MVVQKIETNKEHAQILEKEGLRVTRETVPLDLVTYEHLQAQFPKDFDKAMCSILAKSITKGIIVPHAVVVKERSDEKGSYYELLHKPSTILAYQQCGISTIDVVIVHGNDEFSLDKATDAQLLFLAEQGALIDHILQNIQVERIISEGSIVDEDHVEELESDLSTGQKEPIWVRARLDEAGNLVYDIVDGYHRTDVFRSVGASLIEARISFGMTDEELYDQRVKAAARSAKAVKFARTIILMQNSFHESKWYLEYGLKLSQILSFAASVKSQEPGKNLLSPELGREAIEWAKQKIAVWGGSITTISQQIRCAEDSFPEIIQQVRSLDGGGHEGDGVLNRDKFVAMVDELGQNLQLQRSMVAIIKEHNLNSAQTRVVASALALIEKQPDLIRMIEINPFDTEMMSLILKTKVTIEKGKFIVEKIQKSSQKNVVVASEVIQTEETVPDDEAPADTEEPLSSELDTLAPIDEVVAEAAADTIFEAPSDVPPPRSLDTGVQTGLIHPGSGVKSIGMEVDTGDHPDYDVKRTVAQLEKENEELRNTLEQVNEQLEKGGKRKKSAWYETLATLTQEERAIMRYIYKQKKKFKLNEEPDEAKQYKYMSQIDTALKIEFSLTSNQLSQLKRSAYAKWSLFLQDMFQQEYDQTVLR